MKNFKRICLSFDDDSIKLLDELSKKNHMSKSEFIKFLILFYQNTYGFKTPWLRGTP